MGERARRGERGLRPEDICFSAMCPGCLPRVMKEWLGASVLSASILQKTGEERRHGEVGLCVGRSDQTHALGALGGGESVGQGGWRILPSGSNASRIAN